jgi:large subunit ribosomal protein L4
MKTTLYDQVGREVGSVELADAVFGAAARPDLVHRAVVAQLAAKRAGTAKVKSRGEVAGGGRKPYRQKGTGHARQGSIRAPHFRGGGVTFGPSPRFYDQRLSRKVRRAALRAALSDKHASGKLRVVDRLDFSKYKTRAVVELLADLKLLESRVLIIVDEKNDFLVRSAANVPTVTVRAYDAASVYEIVGADDVVLSRGAAERMGKEYAE